jgi:hypothetical protein
MVVIMRRLATDLFLQFELLQTKNMGSVAGVMSPLYHSAVE